MTKWQDIGSAPTDGRTVRVRRVHGGHTIYDGPARWSRFVGGPLRDPLTGEVFAEAVDEMAWVYPAGHVQEGYKVPAPTSWTDRI